jgi:hypothetical protein
MRDSVPRNTSGLHTARLGKINNFPISYGRVHRTHGGLSDSYASCVPSCEEDMQPVIRTPGESQFGHLS